MLIPRESAPPNRLQVYTVVLLAHAGAYLLLHRAASKRIAPNLWTGVGGVVESHELQDLRASALREVQEETGFTLAEVDDFLLRRVLVHARPGYPLVLLLYFTGTYRNNLPEPAPPACREGTLAWLRPSEIRNLEIIETTRPVIPLLIEDYTHSPALAGPLHLGVAAFLPDGHLKEVVWAA